MGSIQRWDEKLKTIREIFKHNFDKEYHLKLFDMNGNQIYFEDISGFYMTYFYDENNNLIRMDDSIGFWATYTYDANNNVVGYKNSEGAEIKI